MKTPKPLPKEGDKFAYENLLGRMQYLRVVHVDEEDVCYQALVDPLLILGENQPVFWGSKMERLSIPLWRRRLGKRLHLLSPDWEIETHYKRPLPNKHFTGAEWELVQKAAKSLDVYSCINGGCPEDPCTCGAERANTKLQDFLQLLGAKC